VADTVRPTPVIDTLLGLNLAGTILRWAVLVIGVGGAFFWVTILPGMRFTDQDEDLFRAARHGDRGGVERALAAGARIDGAAPVDRKTALFRAAVFGHDEVVRYLLERGANPAARDGDGRTALEVVQEARGEEKDPAAAKALDTVIAVLRDAKGRP
jgi:hypothetical protein